MGWSLRVWVLCWCARLAGQRALVIKRRPGARLRLAVRLAIGPALVGAMVLLALFTVALFVAGHSGLPSG